MCWKCIHSLTPEFLFICKNSLLQMLLLLHHLKFALIFFFIPVQSRQSNTGGMFLIEMPTTSLIHSFLFIGILNLDFTDVDSQYEFDLVQSSLLLSIYSRLHVSAPQGCFNWLDDCNLLEWQRRGRANFFMICSRYLIF